MDPLRHLERVQRDIQENRDTQQVVIMSIAALELKVKEKRAALTNLINTHKEMKAAFKPDFNPLAAQAPTEELRKLLQEACQRGFKQAWDQRELSVRFAACELDTEIDNHLYESEGLSIRLVRLKRREQKLLMEHSTAVTLARESLERLQNEVAQETVGSDS